MAIVKVVSRWTRGVPRLVVLTVALLALVASSAVAGNAGHGTGRVICPQGLPRGCCGPPTLALPTCCPVPTTGCCVPATGPTCCTGSTCTQTLSLAATPDPATDGRTATISGTLTGGTVGAQPVALWQKLPGQTAFSSVATTQTTSSGGFQFVRTTRTDAEWYAESGGATSAVIDEPVRAVIALRGVSGPHSAGATLELSGSVAPSHAGERVALQQLRGRRWVTIARPRLGAHSSFALTRRLRGRSVDRFRVVLAPDARNARSVSAVVAMRA